MFVPAFKAAARFVLMSAPSTIWAFDDPVRSFTVPVRSKLPSLPSSFEVAEIFTSAEAAAKVESSPKPAVRTTWDWLVMPFSASCTVAGSFSPSDAAESSDTVTFAALVS